MEVNALAYSAPLTRPAQFNDEHFSARGSEVHIAPLRSSFDYDRVAMNMEEVKNLLYVVLGGGPGRTRANDQVGSMVNRLV